MKSKWKNEWKISLPVYKIAYSLSFVVILSLIRGVSYSNEVGIAMEAPMAILAAVLCADTYTQEITGKRSEVWRLYPMRSKVTAVMERLAVQEVFLFLLSALGYGLFFLFQRPVFWNTYIPGGEQGTGKEAVQFAFYLAAAAVSLVFWGLLSNTLACLMRNMWAGAGGCLILWLITNSTVGDQCFGAWNLFSYAFRNIEDMSDLSWMRGKVLCLCISVIMAAVLPKILKKRG